MRFQFYRMETLRRTRIYVVPLVVPGLSSDSGTSSSSTSPPQDSSSTSSSPASERSDEHQETGAIHQNPKQKKRITIEPRTSVCETFQNGWRCSLKIWKMQKCLHPHTFLMTQIRNVQQKVELMKYSVYTQFSKDRKLRSMLANQHDKGSLQKTHFRSSTSSRKFGDLITVNRTPSHVTFSRVSPHLFQSRT